MIYQSGDPYGRSQVQPAGAPRDGDRQAPRAAPRAHVRARRAARPRRAADARGHPRRQGEGEALRRVPAELGGEPGDASTSPPATARSSAGSPGCRRSSTRRVETIEVEREAGADGGERPRRRGARAAPVARRPGRAGQDHAVRARSARRSTRRRSSSRRSAGTRSTASPKGDVTIEHIQHSFYMAANYGFQILNGNFAAAIDDYELKLRFMNDLATYRIYVSWLWSLVPPRGADHEGRPPAAADPHRGRRRPRRERASR